MIKYEIIGYIKSKFKDKDSADARLMKKEISYIEIKEEFTDGLFKIEDSQFIDVVFNFHKSDKYYLKTYTYSGNYKGVFATRSPERPSSIGVTTVKLLERNGNVLKVTGLDAIDNTPVLDIKASDTYLLEQNMESISDNRLRSDPRKDILALILARDNEKLLLKAGQLHGHYCPGLALGIMAATYAMNELKVDDSDGLEDILAIVETNNCFSDGVQFVTGCSFGNNALIFKDIGKTAFTLTKRDGKGIRISTKASAKEYMHEKQQEFNAEYIKLVGEKDHSEGTKKGFKFKGIRSAMHTLSLDFNKIFDVVKINIEIPDYAPTYESIICSECGEPVMSSRIVKTKSGSKCFICGCESFNQLDGYGIHKK